MFSPFVFDGRIDYVSKLAHPFLFVKLKENFYFLQKENKFVSKSTSVKTVA